MHPLILLLLIAIVIILANNNMVAAAAIVGLIILADLVGGAVSRIFGFAGKVKGAAAETIALEAAEVEAAKPKPPNGRKFFEEGFSGLGKGIGKGEKYKQEGKKYPDKLNVPTLVESTANFMEGIRKLFKK